MGSQKSTKNNQKGPQPIQLYSNSRWYLEPSGKPTGFVTSVKSNLKLVELFGGQKCLGPSGMSTGVVTSV